MIRKLSIIIPAYNEQKTIIEVLEKITKLELVNRIAKEVLVIDDFSTDDTRTLVEHFCAENPNKVKLYSQEYNQGKGAAIRFGIQQAEGDYIIPQDADLELDPNDINLLLQKAIDDKLDVVYGTRFHTENSIDTNLAYYANRFLTRLSNLFTGFHLTDMEACYKLVKTVIAKELSLKENRFGFEPEITARLAKIKHLKIDEVPISYVGRSYEEGKKIGWKDGLKAIYCIIRYGL